MGSAHDGGVRKRTQHAVPKLNRNEACGPRWYDAPYNATLSTGLRTVGRLSHGVQIGLRHGFDSGLALDHVYRNRAQGITPLGRLLDRVILNTAGWRRHSPSRRNPQPPS